jgi:hypothetical protein
VKINAKQKWRPSEAYSIKEAKCTSASSQKKHPSSFSILFPYFLICGTFIHMTFLLYTIYKYLYYFYNYNIIPVNVFYYFGRVTLGSL